MNLMNRNLGLAALIAVAMSGCRSSPDQESYNDEEKATNVVAYGGGGGSGGNQLISIPLSVDYASFGLLGTPATAYSVTLANCLSAYTATVTQANADGIEVYKNDRNCLAKLTAFTVGGVTYNNVNVGATDFTTWLANDTALFASASAAIIRVKVISQLSTAVVGTEAVVYNFSELLDATSDVIFSESTVSDPHLITVQSQQAPLFKVAASTYIGVNGATGAPQFTFKLECVNDPTLASPTSVAMGLGSATDTLCGLNDLANVSYKLIKDTYSSVLTISNAETIFATAGTSVTIPTDQYQTTATNEGFNTVTLNGPGGLGVAGNENMILILKAGLSFTYYNVDVTTIVQ